MLADVPLPDGGYEAENRHLRALVKAGRAIDSVEIPTIYDGEPSHYRPVVDTVRVGRALLAPSPRAAGERGAIEAFGVIRQWSPRLAALLLREGGRVSRQRRAARRAADAAAGPV